MTSYSDKTLLKSSKIQEVQAQVWEAWRIANSNSTEQKLINLEPLVNAKSGRWELPSNLEPNATMPYYFGYKGEIEKEKQYPLYLYSGSKSNEWATGLTICKEFKDAPSIYFIPQIPNEGNYYRWWQKSKQFAWGKLLRLAFVSGEIDPNRVYFFGISEGGVALYKSDLGGIGK